MTTLTLPTRPWTTFKVCATVIRASSCVNRSNLWTTLSISLSPSNFLLNFSVPHSTTADISDAARTESPFLDLLRCQGKYRKQLHHYFYHDVRQYRSGRNRRIDLQTLEEVPQTLKQLEKSIVTGCNPNGSLAYSFITGRPLKMC